MMNMIRSVWWVGVGGEGGGVCVWKGREEGVCVEGEGGGVCVCGRGGRRDVCVGGGGRCKKCLTGIFTDWVREGVKGA